MPTVPRYDSNVLREVSRTQQNITASPDAFGASTARALGNVGRGIDVIAQRMEEIQIEDDETAAREAAVATADSWRDRLRGEEGYLALSGRNAVDGYDDLQEQIDQDISERTAGMNDRQREIYLRAISSRRESVLNQAASHAASERRAHQVSVESRRIEDATAFALEGRLSPQDFADARAEAFSAIERAGQLQGLEEDEVQRAKGQWLSSARMAAVAAELDLGNLDAAQAIADRATEAEEWMGTDANSVETMLYQANSARRVEQERDLIYAMFPNDPRAAAAYAIDNYEGEEEVSIRRALGSLYRDASVSRGSANAEAFSSIEEGFRTKRYRSMADVPPSLRVRLTARAERILEEAYVGGGASGGVTASGFARTTDVASVENLLWEAEYQVDRFVDRDPVEFRELVATQQEYEALLGVYRSVVQIEDRRSSLNEARELLSDSSALRAYMDAAGLDIEDPDGLRFYERAQSRLDAAGDITATERNQILADLSSEEIRMRGSGMFGRDRTVTAGVADLGEQFSDVSSGMQDVMVQYYADRFDGEIPDPQAIRPVYDRFVQNFMDVNEGQAPRDTPQIREAFSQWLRNDEIANRALQQEQNLFEIRTGRVTNFEGSGVGPVVEEPVVAPGERLRPNSIRRAPLDPAPETPSTGAMEPMTGGQIRAELLALGYSREAAERLTSDWSQTQRAIEIVERGIRARGEDRQ